MRQKTFQERVEKLYGLLAPKGRGYGGSFVVADSAKEVAFFTIVTPEDKKTFRETISIVWLGENGNLRQEEILSLIGFFKTSLDARVETWQILLNVRCEGEEIGEGGVREFDFAIPLNIISEWCQKQRPDKEIIIN